MEIKKGTIVRSKAGRDKGDFQVVMEYDEKYVLVCDGKHRPLEKMKRKKIIHVSVTKNIVHSEQLMTNRLIRKVLLPFIVSVNKKTNLM